MIKKLIPNIIIFLTVINLLSVKVQATELFSDVVKDSWYYEYVSELEKLEIIDGFPDGSFRPDSTLNADQFIKMIVTALGHKPGNGTNYWASSYIEYAEENSLLENNEIDDFKKPLLRGEIACIISKALDFRGEKIGIDTCGLYDIYGYTPIKYHMDVLKTYNAGIISGYMDETFKYDTYITRAEACAVVVKLVTPITRREHQVTSLTPVPVCYSNNKFLIQDYINNFEGNSNCFFTAEKIRFDDSYLSTIYNSKINIQIEETIKLMTDNIVYPTYKINPYYLTC